MSKVVKLEDAHGAVPEHGLGALDSLGIELLGLGTDVHTLTIVGDSVGSNNLGDSVLAKVIGNTVVDGEQNLDTLLLGLLEHLAGALDPVLFLEGLTNGQALSQEEGVGHAATDDQGVSGVDEVIENADLGGNLGTADDGDEGALGLGEDAGQRVDLLLEQEAGDGRQVSGGAHDGTLGAVSGAEGIENEDVTIGSELLGDLGIVLLLTLVKTDVLENEDLARLDGSDSLSSLLAVGVGDKGNVETRELSELLGDGLEGQLGLEAGALGTAEVAHEDDASVVLNEIVDGGQGSLDTGGVANDAILDRHVKVNADENALAVDIDVADGLLGKGHVCFYLSYVSAFHYGRRFPIKRARP